jgi:hypothetical protein
MARSFDADRSSYSMRYRLDLVHPTVTDKRHAFRLMTAAGISAVVAIWLGAWSLPGATAQEPGLLPSIEPGDMGDGPPVTHVGGAGFYSQELGTLLRLRYNTQSYGQDESGNLDIGTMQVFNLDFDDAITFVDGQVTLNDKQGTGFNVGIGYRRLACVPLFWEPERMVGLSVWADGTSTEAGNFFPQIGISYESLGELWDFRANGYIPIGEEDQFGKFEPTGETGFLGNFLAELTQATVDHSLNVGELEVARRLGVERDAWLFAGGYALANSTDETGGYRVGLRGYAYPDLLLQFAVSDDELFKTNAVFSITWFVGRTRSDYHPACGLPDRFREPVMRNDYVALTRTTAAGGEPLHYPEDQGGEAIRVVHVDSAAADGGDGSYEHPLNDLDNIHGNSQDGDIVLAWANSEFTGQEAVLRDNQRFLGEGDDYEHLVTTAEKGTILIPETSPGARADPRPQILADSLATVTDAITLADLNEVANFDINGQDAGDLLPYMARAIASPAQGSGNPNLHDLAISYTTGNAIELTPYEFVDDDDIDEDDNTTETIVHGNVTIDTVTFAHIGGDDINIDSATTVDVTDPAVTLQETISITSVASTFGAGAGVRLANTHDTGTATITDYTNGNATAGSGGGLAGEGVLLFQGTAEDDFGGDVTISNADILNNRGFAFDFLNVASTTAVTLGTGSSWDGGAGAAGGIRADNFNGTLAASSTTLKNGDGTLGGVQLLGKSDGTFTFANTVTFTDIDGTDFEVDGGAVDHEFTGTVTLNSDLDNSDGHSVEIRGLSDSATRVTLNGDITDTALGVLIEENIGGTVQFNGDLTMTTGANDAITLTNNDDTTITFAGLLDITTTSGTGFLATGGGNLTAASTTNSISTTSGTAVNIDGMTVGSTGVAFGHVESTEAAGSAVVLRDNTGPIVIGTVGEEAGESGVITAAAGNVSNIIDIDNSANVTVSGLEINNAAGTTAGVAVAYATDDDDMTVNLNNLEINDGLAGIAVTGSDDDTVSLTMTVNDTAVNRVAGVAVSFDKVGAGTIEGNSIDIAGGNVANSAGILIKDSGADASFTFDEDTSITAVQGTDFEVSGGEGTINVASDLTNTDGLGRTIYVHGITGGSVTMTGTVEDTAAGIEISQNAGGDIYLLGEYTLNAAANARILVDSNSEDTTVTVRDVTIIDTTGDGILISDNADTVSIDFDTVDITTTGTGRGIVMTGNGTDTSTSFNDLTILTENGDGFNASGGGNLTISSSSGFENTIETGAAVALTIDGMNVVTGVNFHSVSADSGLNGIVLNDVTGDAITIGASGAEEGEGGTIANTTGVGISITNTASVTLNGVTVEGAGGDAVLLQQDDAEDMDVALNTLTVDGATGAGIHVDGTGGTGTFDITSTGGTIEGATGAGIEVEGRVSTASFTQDITNTAGQAIYVHDLTEGTVSHTGEVTGNGVLIADNEDATINLLGDYTLDTDANDAFTVTGNKGTTAVSVNSLTTTTTSGDGVVISGNESTTSIDLVDVNITATGTGAGFAASGDGDLTVSGTDNTITTATGTGLTIDGLNIVTGVSFESVDVSGANNGIVLNDVTGSAITIGDTGNNPGDGGTIENTTGAGISITNTADVVLNGVTVEGAGGDAVLLAHSNSASMSVTLNDLTVDTTNGGLHLNGTGGSGTFDVSGTGGTITAGGADIEVQGHVSTATLTQDITNTATGGRSIYVHGLTAGTVTHSGSVTDSGTGILIDGNSGGSINLTGDYTLDTGANDAFTVSNNTGTTAVVANDLDITTSSGDGIVLLDNADTTSVDLTDVTIEATGTGSGLTATVTTPGDTGATLTVSGTNNTIQTATGVGLDIEDCAIGTSGVNFKSVTVSGAANGIVLDTLTGGSVNIGNASGAANSGGTLNTTGTAISITDVEYVNLQHVYVASAGDDGISLMHSSTATMDMDVTINGLNLSDANGDGIAVAAQNNSNSFALRLTGSDLSRNVTMASTGSGDFGLLVDSTTVNNSTGPEIAFELAFSGSSINSDLTFRNGNTFTAGDASALSITSVGAAAKDIKLWIDGTADANIFRNASAGSAAAHFSSGGNTLFQATIQGNEFEDSLAGGSDFTMLNDGGATARIRLNLGGSDSTEFNKATGQGEFNVTNNGTPSAFGVYEKVDTFDDLRNDDPVVPNPDNPPLYPEFDNLVSPPTLPTVP